MTPSPSPRSIADPIASLAFRIESSGEGRRSNPRDLVSVLTSAVIHAALLVSLFLCVLPAFSARKQILIVSIADSKTNVFEFVELSVEVEMPVTDLFDAAVDVEMPVTGLLDAAGDVANSLDTPQMEISALQPAPNSGASAIASLLPREVSQQSLSASTTVESAVDRITSELHAKLQQGDLLVVWLLDSSNSLVDDRKRIAARLTPFYEGLVADRHSSKHQLLSAVVSYGSKMRERVSPTEFGKKIVAAVHRLPVDRLGNEMVFDAVAKCAVHYRSSWDHQIAFVIWTDESGDDVQYLEDTIETCRDQKTSVSVVGPSSVLGADTGLHSYLDPKSRAVYQLPVRRGPDTALPERIELGYWYLTRSEGGGRRRGAGGPSLPSWMGGQDLQGLLGSFSPYALTRLSMQTGGSYTIFDRPEDRGPFDLTTMSRYAPKYRSIDNYRKEVQTHPLRAAVMEAVGTLTGKKVGEPKRMLFVKQNGPRVFDFMRFYYSPSEFQSKLRSSKRRLLREASRYSKLVDTALQHVSEDGNREVGLEGLYRYEESPRWRAWYDLTRGRLLATSVRLEEYRLTLEEAAKPGALANTTNHILLIASPNLRSGPVFQDRAEEGERLLRRCVRENRGTPWETLAQRELDFALGVGVREMALVRQPSGPASRQPNLPRF